MFDLVGKVAVVTGGESGIGLAISRHLAQAGVKTVIGGILQEAGDKAAADIVAGGGEALFIKTDVRSQAQVEHLVQSAVERYGKLDIMVNNAGVFDGFADVLETTEELWDQITGINLKGCFFGCQAALKRMLPNGSGRIINTSSIGGLTGKADGASYTASKFAVIGLTRQMASSHSESGVTFNAVCPGVIATDIRGNSAAILPSAAHLMNRGVGAADPEAYKKSIPARRKGTADEVAAAVLFLASDEASYITGHSLVVDGGFIC